MGKFARTGTDLAQSRCMTCSEQTLHLKRERVTNTTRIRLSGPQGSILIEIRTLLSPTQSRLVDRASFDNWVTEQRQFEMWLEERLRKLDEKHSPNAPGSPQSETPVDLPELACRNSGPIDRVDKSR